MITKPVIKDNHRWFIWTIVFLIVSGVSLTSYIMISEINMDTEIIESNSAYR